MSHYFSTSRFVSRPIVMRALASVVLILSVLGLPRDAQAADQAMWIWGEAALIRSSPAARNGAVNFMKANGINTAYLFTPGTILSAEGDNYRALISQFHANGIQVYALDGAPDYILPGAGRTAAEFNLQGVLLYNFNSAPNERFDGFNADVEPWALSTWNTNTAQHVQQYLDLATQYMDMKSFWGDTLQVGPATPFWFDQTTASPAFDNVTYNGITKPFYQHVQDIYDYVTIMDYRDFATGTGGIIDLASAEMAYAATIGKSVVIGVETQNIAPDIVTFFEEGPAALQTALAQTQAAYGAQPEFGGFALHHYGALLDFLPPPSQPGDLNGDGIVDILDLNLILGGWNQNVVAGDIWSGDVDGDGVITIVDLNNILGSWNAGAPPDAGSSAPIPEPASWLVWTCGAWFLRRRPTSGE